jgi:hypothetical protein
LDKADDVKASESVSKDEIKPPVISEDVSNILNEK